jgi:hypothetical protein
VISRRWDLSMEAAHPGLASGFLLETGQVCVFSECIFSRANPQLSQLDGSHKRASVHTEAPLSLVF